MISPCDTLDMIFTTIKNSFGLDPDHGVSFQDTDGHVLIATYENLEHNMIVYVRISAQHPTGVVVKSRV